MRLVAYAWNDTTEARISIELPSITGISSSRQGSSLSAQSYHIKKNMFVLPTTGALKSVSIMSTSGRLLYTIPIMQDVKTISLDNGKVPAGMYLAEIRGRDAKTVARVPWLKVR